MTDNFEKAKDDILKRTAGNGGPGPMDLLVAMGALAADQDNDHRESMRAMKGIVKRLEVHQVEANVRDQEIADLQDWRRRSAEGCQERIEAIVKPLIEASHDIVHQRHLDESHGGLERRKDDPPDSAFLEVRGSAFPGSMPDERSFREMMLAWSATKKVLAVIASAAILIIVGITVSYAGHELADEEQPVPQPVVTVTASPTPSVDQ